MTDVEQSTDIALWKTEVGQCPYRLADLLRRDPLPLDGFCPGLPGVGDDSLGCRSQALANDDVERVGCDVEQQGDRIAGHRLDMFEPLGLAEDARQLRNPNGPPALVGLDDRRVDRSHVSHHRVPSSSSNAFMIAWAVPSLISRWRGIVIHRWSSAQISWAAPWRTNSQVMPLRRAASPISLTRSRRFTDDRQVRLPRQAKTCCLRGTADSSGHDGVGRSTATYLDNALAELRPAHPRRVRRPRPPSAATSSPTGATRSAAAASSSASSRARCGACRALPGVQPLDDRVLTP